MDFEDNNQPYYTEDKPNYLKEILQWILLIIIALTIAVLVRAVVFEFVSVEGPSMQNTLFTGEKLMVYKLGYKFSEPKHGDIIVFKYQDGVTTDNSFLNEVPFLNKILTPPGEVDYIKRVIGVPGDEIDIKDGYVYVNGEKQEEPYTATQGSTETFSEVSFPLKVPDHKILAFGDNRRSSKDSRQIGLIDEDRIKGKAVFRIFPFNRFGVLN